MGELAVYSGPQFELAKHETSDVIEMIRANLGAGGSDLSRFDLPRVGMPAGGGASWTVPGDDGEPDSIKEITGVVLFQSDKRALWLKEYGDGESGPPDCSSEDGIWGEGKISDAAPKMRQRCAECPMAQFGTKPDPKKPGAFKKGQACGARKLLFVAVEKRLLPMVVDLSPGSLATWRKFVMNLTSQALPIHSVVVSLGLAPDKNDDGIKYSIVQPKILARLDSDQAAKMKRYAHEMKVVFDAEPAVRVTSDGAAVPDRTVIDTTAVGRDSE